MTNIIPKISTLAKTRQKLSSAGSAAEEGGESTPAVATVLASQKFEVPNGAEANEVLTDIRGGKLAAQYKDRMSSTSRA